MVKRASWSGLRMYFAVVAAWLTRIYRAQMQIRPPRSQAEAWQCPLIIRLTSVTTRAWATAAVRSVVPVEVEWLETGPRMFHLLAVVPVDICHLYPGNNLCRTIIFLVDSFFTSTSATEEVSRRYYLFSLFTQIKLIIQIFFCRSNHKKLHNFFPILFDLDRIV